MFKKNHSVVEKRIGEAKNRQWVTVLTFRDCLAGLKIQTITAIFFHSSLDLYEFC
jgi:hypothetical protein